jgi:hypothetical protein
MNWQPIITYRPFTVAIGIHYIQVFAAVEYKEEAEELIRVLEFCKASFTQPDRAESQAQQDDQDG